MKKKERVCGDCNKFDRDNPVSTATIVDEKGTTKNILAKTLCCENGFAWDDKTCLYPDEFIPFTENK